MGERRFGSYVVETSHEDKELFSGVTKARLIDYYESVAEVMLPHLRDRPVSLERFPDGAGGEVFYQKQVPDYFPDWIDRVSVPTEAGPQEQVVCSHVATLAYLANQVCVPHAWLSRRDEVDHPDLLLLDLDPPGDDFEPVRRAARWCRDLLEEVELPAFVKTTGSRGLHVAVPLDRSASFDEARAFARDLARVLAERHPDALTTEQRKAKRRGRLYLDTTRNAYGQTAVAPYAVRALPEAPVATPLDWDELGRGSLTPRSYTLANVGRRLGQRRDPWAGLSRRAHAIAPARERLARLEGGGR